MLLSFSKKIDRGQYTKLIPTFLRLLSNHGYSQAQIESTVEVMRDNEIFSYHHLPVKELLDILSTSNFVKGNLIVKQENKSIQMIYRKFNNDLYFETDFPPSLDFKNDLLTLFKTIKSHM